MRLSIIIPAYNEENRLAKTLSAINGYLSAQNFDYEVIVVNDGSTDNTAESIRGVSAGIRNFRLIENDKNSGKGAAVKQGILAAKGDYLIYVDADNAISIDQVDGFWPYLEKGFAIVIGSIEVAGATTGLPAAWYRHIFGKLGKYLIRATVLPGIRDSQRAFKLFSKDTAVKIFKRLTINGWGFDIEVLVIARKLGFRIKELPVAWLNDSDSRIKLTDYWKTWRELMKIKKNLSTGRY